ncbi:MAG: class I SAM-dependent methyltransferase [Dehalococcoidia bacterium]|nr:class I SAM-dependent methyltransferase [Dehalococcoidia bacterium]
MPIWEVYSCFYGLSLSRLFPYRQLLEELNSALDIKTGHCVLDAGCGPGLVIEKVIRENKSKGISITGVDFSRAMLRQARRRCRGEAAVKLHVADLNKELEFGDDTFDRVICSNTLYALQSPARTIAELRRVLKPGGLLVAANPKPEAGQRQIMNEHVAAIKKLTPLHRRVHGFVVTLSLTPVNLIVMAINRTIIDRGRAKGYHFLDEEGLRNALLEAGFCDIEIRSCYADQDWLVRAPK